MRGDETDSPVLTPGHATSLNRSAQRASDLLLHRARSDSSEQGMTMREIADGDQSGQGEEETLLDIRDDDAENDRGTGSEKRRHSTSSSRSELFDDTLPVSAYEAPVIEREALSKELKEHLKEVGGELGKLKGAEQTSS